MPGWILRAAASGLLVLLAVAPARSQRTACATGIQSGSVESMFARGEFKRAVELLERTLASRPKCDPELWVMLAVAYQNLHMGERAVNACSRGLSAFPNSMRLQEHFGLLLVENLPRPDALGRLDEAVRMHPHSAPLQKALGRLLFDPPTDDPKAGQHLAAAARLNPKDPEARYFHGVWACTNAAAWANLVGRRLPVVRESYQLCLRELEQALILTPADNFQAVMQIHTNIGSAEEAMGNLEKAEAAFREALTANRRLGAPNPAVALEYARFLIRKSEIAEAKTILNGILAYDAHHALARFERARLFLDDGLTDRAIEDASLALKDANENSALLRRIHSFLARTYHEVGREREAAFHQSRVDARQ